MTDELTVLFVENVANHFEGASIGEDGTIDVGFGEARIRPWVHAVQRMGPALVQANLFLELWGGRLGEVPVFASISGYADSEQAAVIVGSCNWSCAFGPLLRAALAGGDPGQAEDGTVAVHGQAFRLLVDSMDRVLSFSEEEQGERMGAARRRLGGDPHFARALAGSGLLPPLPTGEVSVLSVLVMDGAASRTVEVKVNGEDWPAASAFFAGRPAEPDGALVVLRELALLVPAGEAPPLSAAAVEGALAGLAHPLGGGRPRATTAWPGWTAHGGRLGARASEEQVLALETDVGPLPPGYRRFLLEVAASGAGPGYGLIEPFGAGQRALAGGDFAWVHGERPADPPRGVLVLAHAGCCMMWLLVLRGPHRGQVWVDAGGSDQLARRVAPSFEAWYRDWLDAAVRDRTFVHWDARACATAGALSSYFQAEDEAGRSFEEALARLSGLLGPGALTVASGGGEYFERGDPLDPCEGCVALTGRLGIGIEAFRTGGAVPLQAR